MNWRDFVEANSCVEKILLQDRDGIYGAMDFTTRDRYRQVIDRLKPLAKPGTAWFGSAGEMTAISYMKMGKDNLAGPIFAQIAKQEDLPQTLRARAQQMAGALGVDTVQLDVKPAGASAAADAGKDK